MSTIKSSDEHLTLNADGASKDIKFQSNGVEKASIDSSGNLTVSGNLTSVGIDDNADATAITIDSSENVGFGVTPETDWYPKVIQSGNRGAVYGYSNQTHLSNNAKMIDVSENYKYMESSYATDYSQEGGTHQFKVAASGTADAAITWTTPLNITNDGRGLSNFTAKVWVRFNGQSTPTIQGSHNVSSITDNAVGQWTVNFANNMTGTNYTAATSQENYSWDTVVKVSQTSMLAGSCKLLGVRVANNSYEDSRLIALVIFGGQ